MQYSQQNNKKNQLIYMVAGFIPFFLYAIFHMNKGIYHIGVLSLIDASVIGWLIISMLRGRHLSWQFDILICLMSFSVVYICYFIGIRGIVFIFPVIIGLFFNYSIKTAFTASLLFSCISLLASLNSIETHVVARTSIPIIITIVISYLYAVQINKHKNALLNEANRDYLTGIFNRRSFMAWLSQCINQLDNNKEVAVYFVDLDDFKRVNDNHGHAVGDRLLNVIAQRLMSVASTNDPALTNHKTARIAGDEFIVALFGNVNEIKFDQIGGKLLEKVNEPIFINDIKFEISASIGIASTSTKDDDSERLINDADRAMFSAKRKGKNKVEFFSQALADEINFKNKIVSILEDVITQDAFYLKFMPMYNASKTIIGAEALIRTDDTVLKNIGPEQYIPIAEEFGLISSIDLIVVEKTFKYLASISSLKEEFPFIMAINISAQELNKYDFPNKIEQLANKYGIDPNTVEFEITETSLIDFEKQNMDVLNRLKQQGYKLALDDFGTGYTAFSQLKNYPVDTLKIDKSFVGNIDKNDKEQNSMVDVILSLANIYGLVVVAEGVEEAFQLEYLKDLGCDYYQGFYLSRPIDWNVLVQLITEQPAIYYSA